MKKFFSPFCNSSEKQKSVPKQKYVSFVNELIQSMMSLSISICVNCQIVATLPLKECGFLHGIYIWPKTRMEKRILPKKIKFNYFSPKKQRKCLFFGELREMVWERIMVSGGDNLIY